MIKKDSLEKFNTKIIEIAPTFNFIPSKILLLASIISKIIQNSMVAS